MLRASDGKRFLKRDCAHEHTPFDSVVHTLFGDQDSQPSRRLYARAPLADGLHDGVRLDGLEELVGGAPGAHAFRMSSCGVWLGSAGCVTPLHYDLCHGFLVGVRGTKRVTYFAPDDFALVYPRDEQPELATVDLEAWREGLGTAAGRAEHAAHPAFAEATAWHAELRPGDVLYTPPYWWHHVETTDDAPALSVLVPFDPTADEPMHACHFR